MVVTDELHLVGGTKRVGGQGCMTGPPSAVRWLTQRAGASPGWVAGLPAPVAIWPGVAGGLGVGGVPEAPGSAVSDGRL